MFFLDTMLILLLFLSSTSNAQSNEAPQVKDVSAMCTINGITASIVFDRPFSGLIYSLGYERVHECIYYNSVLTESVLFSIPVIGCGTRKNYNSHEMLETLENRVYVQMDKFAQTASDKQFAFVCQQPYAPPVSNEIRRHPGSLGKPIVPIVKNGYQINDNWKQPPIRQPNYLLHGLDPNYFQKPFDQQKTQTYPIVQTTPSNFFSNSIIENGPFSKKATTHAFGHRNSWQMFGPNQPHGFDDFMSQTTETTVDNVDSDLLQMQTQPPTTSTSTTVKTPVIASKSASSIDIPRPKPETRLFATQQFDKLSDSIQLEIQKGQGPFNKSIDSAVKIGDLISLTVHGKSASNDESQYNMFVHSCYASDENNTIKINLIDSSGCAIHSQVLQPMQRLRKEDQIFYFFPLKAFKFPGPTEVFFYCSVDLSPEYNFPLLCNKTRKIRSIHTVSADDKWVELNLSKNMTIEMPNTEEVQRVEGITEKEAIGNSVLIGGLFALLALTVSSTALAMIFVFKFRK